MSPAKILFAFICFLGMSACSDRNGSGSPEDRESFEKTKALILEGFAKGDVDAVLALHHPDVVKYFGGKNIVSGREGLRKQLTDMFNYAKTEFVENKIESTVFNEEAVVETSIFAIRSTPKNGDSSRVFRGRSMVVYVRYNDSPTGWASLREMTQEGD
ncbi:MAG TPA: nuclear transport factor 2 family protein [Puia sp.]|nr:nuclear transport factor 2 family protein [Puia sp.]